MILSHATLLIRIPQIGPEMRVGFNCAGLEQSSDGLLIREPMTANGALCAYDVLVTPWGYSKLPREVPVVVVGPRHSCPVCSQGFSTAQGLGSHLARKHAKESAE